MLKYEMIVNDLQKRIMNEEFEEGTYTIQFERVGKSSQAQEKRGWVEVGALTVRKEKKESVDRSKLQREIQICEKNS